MQALNVADGPCTLGGTAGYCLTPANLSGQVGAIWLLAQGGGPPHRILGHSVNLGIDRDGHFEVEPFDFANPAPIAGEPALTDIAPGTALTGLGLNLALLDVQAAVVPGEVWNLRFAFVAQPFTEDPGIQECLAIDAHYAERLASGTVLVPNAPSMRRGDVLLCKSPSENSGCDAGAYRWVDTDSGALTALRPANPLTVASALRAPRCDVSSGHPDIDAYGHSLTAELRAPITLWSSYENCYQRFFTSANASGTKLTVALEFDTRAFLFFRGLDSLAGRTEAELLAALVPQSVFWSQRQPEGASETTLGVTATLTLSDAPNDCGGTGVNGGHAPSPGAAPAPGSDAGATVNRDVDADGKYTCIDFCSESTSCNGGPSSSCSQMCTAVASLVGAGGCGEPLQALLGCTERAPACAGSCKVEDDAFSACLQGYCAGHSSDASCAVVAAIFQRK